MPFYDFSTVLTHRNGKPFTCMSLGILSDEIYDDPGDFQKPVAIGLALELILLYGRPPNGGERFTGQQKRERSQLASRLNGNGYGEMELTSADVKLLRDAISVLQTEPFGAVDRFLDDSIVDR